MIMGELWVANEAAAKLLDFSDVTKTKLSWLLK
jgi:hypothetical protein